MSNQQIENQPPTHDWGDEVALEALRGEANTPADNEYLDAVDKELAASLKESLGHEAVKLVQLPDGTITTHDRVEAERNAGHDVRPTSYGGRV